MDTTCTRPGCDAERAPKHSICRKHKAALARSYRENTKLAAAQEIIERLAALPEEELAAVRVVCNTCREGKPLRDFHVARSRKPWGRHARCKMCVSAYDVGRRRDYSAEYRSGIKRASHFKLKYGITQGQFDALVLGQSGLCAICDKQGDLERHGRLSVDHDHALPEGSGSVRGLLCGECNHGIGKLGDDPERLRRAMEYLLDPPARRVLA